VKPPPSLDDFLEGLSGPEPGTAGSERVVAKAVREYCGAVHAYLRDHRREIGGGLALNELRSDLIDQLIRRLFALAEESYFSESGDGPSPLVVLAVGGYARREMAIYSDIDLLFLHEGKITPHVASVAEKIQYWLWDAQLAIGCATRTIDDTLRLAANDSTVRTAVMETRFLVGSGALFQVFSDHRRQSLFAAPDRFIEEQVEGLRARDTHFGDSLYLLQPNVKESAGGLRDYHAAYWAMQATQPHARGRENFLYLGLLTDIELHEFTRALDFLWQVRNELHLISERKGDQMSFELQERIANSLGYDKSPEGSRELPVERFMGDYYRHARVISNYSSLVIEQCLARVRRKRRPRPPKQVEEGFRIRLGHLEVPHVRMLRERPLRLLTAFAVAQAHDVSLTWKARRMVRENLSRIDDDFRRSREVREVFLKILESDKRVMRTLAAMNEAGVMAALLPEWEHIVCRWQHVMYHTYTVDVHSIFLVEELRRLWRGKYREDFANLTELMQEVDDLPVLYLGCLLHDIGKGLGTDHSNVGADRARTCVERLGLDDEQCDRVVFLVRHHLLMSHLAQRRDLSDPKLILEFARIAGDRVNLRNLYLVTFADIRASSSSAWTEWKGRLIRELFERTSELLEEGAEDSSAAIEIIERRAESRREAAAAELRDMGVSEEDIGEYFESMPRRYFTAHSPREIARHAGVVLEVGPDRVLSTDVRELPEFSEFILSAQDAHGLFANVAGVLTAYNLNILGAHVYSSRTGLALEVYRVATPPGGEAERRMIWDDVKRSLEQVLADRLEVGALLKRRGRPVGITQTPSRRPVVVLISNQESDFYTIVDVTANDRLGLLHDLARTIAEHGYEIYISKAATIMDQVTDTFYLKDGAGGKLRDADAIDRLRTGLLEAADFPESDRDG
jgi:[protein-PII] uridylyltransferase